MSYLRVDIGELVRTANDLNELNESLKNRINNLISQEAALNNMWEGEARERFHNAFNSDINQMKVFSDTVSKYVEVLLKIAQSYAEHESQNVQVANTRIY